MSDAMSMRERIARAIENERFPHCKGMKLNPGAASYRYADAALATMEEPTEAMMMAAIDNWPDRKDRTFWNVAVANYAGLIRAARDGK